VQEIDTYFDSINGIIEQYLKSDAKSLKRLAIETVNNVSQTNHAIKVLKRYNNLIPLVLGALSLDDEDMIFKIFETLTDLLESKKAMQLHLEICVKAAINVSKMTDMSYNVREATIYFLERCGFEYGSFMAKKHMT